MKKIYFVRRQHNPFGGVERYFERLVKEMKRRGKFDVEVLHITQPKWMPSWIKLPWYDYQVCSTRKEGVYFSNDRLSCLDIHRAGGGTHKTFLKVKGFSLNPLHPVYLWLEKRALENSRQIIAISKMVKRNIIDDYGIDEKKITVIYNGIDMEEIPEEAIHEKKVKIFEEFALEEMDLPVILYVGSGYERKGVWEFLEILSRLKSPFHAFVVGKEKHMRKYIQRAETLGIAKRVTFAGPRRDVENFYAASDIFLFPSHYEPFGSVVLEAMHFGNAIITTRQTGAGEILETEPRMETPKDFTIIPYIEELLQNRSKLENIKKHNRTLVENYSMKRNVDETIAVIEKVLD
ncbi:glycosyltransferase family 4 protein [Hydrogenimonas urashimensis]|uniref:glycosyltransferase family 4 protein n=1 Tax=Hydrogenimonas urashimensis TaxID=2740515 RepID=UPI001916A37D|nr:glycosyltransferase family 4 protein [Hydrogenimonas urashimensis]